MKRVRIADIMPPKLHRDVMSEKLYQHHFHVLLHEPYDQKGMLIGLDMYEARPLAMALQDLPFDRREIYGFVENLLEKAAMKMDGLYIVGSVTGGPLETVIRLHKKKEKFEVPCRPSDGFCLAVQLKTPIYIRNEMLDKFSFQIPKKYHDLEMRQQGLTDLVKDIQEGLKAYEKELVEMSRKAAKKSMEAYAASSKEVMDFVFGELS